MPHLVTTVVLPHLTAVVCNRSAASKTTLGTALCTSLHSQISLKQIMHTCFCCRHSWSAPHPHSSWTQRHTGQFHVPHAPLFPGEACEGLQQDQGLLPALRLSGCAGQFHLPAAMVLHTEGFHSTPVETHSLKWLSCLLVQDINGYVHT